MFRKNLRFEWPGDKKIAKIQERGRDKSLKHIVFTEKTVRALTAVAVHAGQAILDVYRSPEFSKSTEKADGSPITEADRASQAIITSELPSVFPEVPIISEENDASVNEGVRGARFVWYVDPLDGTKEFINHTDEFTVNIALVEKGRPKFGLIYIPCWATTYYAVRGQGSFKICSGHDKELIQTRKRPSSNLAVLGSRFHAGSEWKLIAKTWPEAERVVVGSAIKFCALAEGKADFYLRERPTCFWDTAAGQIIVEEAGGLVVDWQQKPLEYLAPSLQNPSFAVVADPTFEWQRCLKGKGD